MAIVIMRLWPATSLQERDCFILGRALDPVTRPCTCCVIAQIISQDTPQSGLAQSVHSQPHAVHWTASLSRKPMLDSVHSLAHCAQTYFLVGLCTSC